jgi:hypothetical protein
MLDRPPAGLVVFTATLYSSAFAFLWWQVGIGVALAGFAIIGLVALFAAACFRYDFRHH